MWKFEFLQKFDLISGTFTNTSCTPFSHTINSEDSSFFKMTWIKSACCVGQMVFRKQEWNSRLIKISNLCQSGIDLLL